MQLSLKPPFHLAFAVLAGCATLGEQPQLSGSSWQVVAINGRAAEGELRFGAADFTGDFGCNMVGGTYRLDGAVLRSGPIQVTRMACVSLSPENPSPMALEEAAMAVIAHDPRLIWNGRDRLVLRAISGEITLLRQHGFEQRKP